jgi:hypothetical protein
MTTRTTPNPWAVGGTIFAAIVMVMAGVFQFLMGLAAIIDDQFFVVGPHYAYAVDTTTWGWIHMLLGVLLIVIGACLFTAAAWARWVGIILVVLAAIANFMYVPYYPLWALALIGVDIFVIWALATTRRGEIA